MNNQLDGSFDDIAVAEFRSATALESNFFTASGECLELLEGLKDTAFASVELSGKPIVVLGDSLLPGLNPVGRSSTSKIGPLVTERSAAANVEGIVWWTRIGMPVDYDDVFEFCRR